MVASFGFSNSTNPIYITGYLKNGSTDTSLSLSSIPIIVKGDGKTLARARTNKKGVFEVSFVPGKEKSFDFFAITDSFDTILLASVKIFENDTPTMTFFLPAKAKRNAFGQTLCPKCKKTDKTFKIAYGDGLPTGEIVIKENGDTIYSPIVNGKYYAGHCLVAMAKPNSQQDE